MTPDASTCLVHARNFLIMRSAFRFENRPRKKEVNSYPVALSGVNARCGIRVCCLLLRFAGIYSKP